ncbi:MAG: DNA polymerase I, partial [Peptococcaceae bacterium]|nr:DNA polymerase I [Peptococcaceae bacterium]
LTKKGISELEVVDEQALREKYQLEPLQVIDLKGLMGDTSDNIPGVPGIGEKTALKLLWQFGSVENVLANADQVDGKKIRQNLTDFAGQAVLSKQLATIDTNVPVELDLDTCALTDPDFTKLLAIFQELEFKNLVKSVAAQLNVQPGLLQATPNGFVQPQAVMEIKDGAKLSEFWSQLQAPIGLYFEYSGNNAREGEIIGLGITGGLCGYLTHEALKDAEMWQCLAPLLGDGQPKAVHDAKKAISYLTVKGLSLSAIEIDLMLAAYLINPSGSKYDLATLGLDHLNWVLNQEPGYLGINSAVILQLALILRDMLNEMDLWQLLHEIELPLAAVLAKMELAGIKLDRMMLTEMGELISNRLNELETDIFTLADGKFNINSPQQLGVILFEKLKLPVLKKTKTGYSTNAEVLEELEPQHPIIAKLLEYRQLSKLNSTYIEGLKAIQDPLTGRVYTSFNQTITVTGRLSSTEPNLQNIPIRLDLGRQIRKAFVPSAADMVILAADYSQIELRILAHIAGDTNMIAAFEREEDIHTRTASEIFGVSLTEVTPEMRRGAKSVNFGLVYGIGDYSLSRDIGVTRREAKAYIDNYFARYPMVKAWMDNISVEARAKGYVTTIAKRRRNLPDLFSSNRIVRAAGERTAMNTPIQGSAADIIKLAMVKIDRALIGYKTRMLLQVHDELIFEVPQTELATIQDLVRDCMENAFPLAVRLKVDLKVGPNWYDLRKI